MITVAKIFTTCFGIGYIQKGAGTIAALFCCAVWYAFRLDLLGWEWQLLQIALLFLLGALASTKMEATWGHDSNRIVADEWLGMCVALFLVPFTWLNLAIAFVLFRAFDIGKPLFIRRAERFPKGWGVMMDDLLAGIYSNLILHLLIKSHLF
ncbi:MAG TPA: phosphatidylglycerophosphatase A [Flavisolibacter sp.]|nr:phosphatidylglycerophosphatase A [Flavisolibacter sp.]